MLLFSLAFLLTNCQKDELIDAQQDSLIDKRHDFSKVRVNIINSNEILSNRNLSKNLKGFSSNNRPSSNSHENILYNEEYGFSINTDFVKHVVNGDYNSYNFIVSRDDPVDDKLENLVLSLNENGRYDAFILKYDFTAEQFENIKLDSLKNTTTIYTPIDFDSTFLDPEPSVSNRVQENIICLEEWTFNDPIEHNGDNHGADCTCSAHSGNWVLSSSECYSTGGVGTDGFDPKNYSGEGGTTSGGGGGGIVTAPNMEGYEGKLKNFERGILDDDERNYYKSDPSIEYTINTFLKQNNFLEFSENEVKASLSFGNTLELNFQLFNWAFVNRSSIDLMEIKDDLIEFSLESRTIAKMKIDAFRAKNGWVNSSGSFPNRPSLNYKATFIPNPGEMMYLLENGLVLYQSSTKRQINLNIPGTLASSEVPTEGYNYIYNYDTKTWYEYRMPKTVPHADADIDFLINGFWDGAIIVGRYASPLEDAIILIDGKDFDGVEQSRVATAGVMIVGLVPGGKLMKPVTKIAGNIIKYRKLVKVTVNGVNKNISLPINIVNGIVEFGSDSYNRSQLRKILNITNSTTHAHHIIPFNFRTNPLIQKAANSDAVFHISEKLNGFPLASSNHLTGHYIYSNKIQNILSANNNAINNMNPNQAYTFLQGLVTHIDNLLIANPNKNLGEIANLINYP